MRRRLACGTLALALGLAGCDGCASPVSSEEGARVVTIDALDTLAAGGEVSVGGVVIEEDDRLLVLQDASGLVRVRLADEPPPLYGERLLVQGTLRSGDDGLRIDATEWLYDSTRTGR